MATDRKFTYERRARELELQPRSTSVSEVSVPSSEASIDLGYTLKGYEKIDGIFSYHIICVISGGERTEKNFLHELTRKKELRSLRVAFVSEKGQGLQPYQMQEKWADIQKSGEVVLPDQHYQLDKMDKVFLLSDVDEFYEQLVKISDEATNQEAGQWIISNPCFEMWLYYCFKNAPETDLASLKTCGVDKRSQEMKRSGNKDGFGGYDARRAFEKMSDGIKHSKEHYAEDEHSIPVLYATQMYEMAQYLIDTMNSAANEYNEFLQRNKEWRETMKRKA